MFVTRGTTRCLLAQGLTSAEGGVMGSASHDNIPRATLQWLTGQNGTGGSNLTTHERLDYAVQFKCPKHWELHPVVRENFLLIRAVPSQSQLDGLSINAFAYHKKIINPDPITLLSRFLTQFQRNMYESTVSSAPSRPEGSSLAFASLDFVSKSSPLRGRSLVTALFHPSHRYHYVCVFAARREVWLEDEALMEAFAREVLGSVSCLTAQ